MLRTSFRSARELSTRPLAAAAGRQWQPTAVRSGALAGKRYYVDRNKAKPAAMPTSETNTSPTTPPPKTDSIAAKTIPAVNVPLEPPAPGAADAKIAVPVSNAPLQPPAPEVVKPATVYTPPTPPPQRPTPSPPRKAGFFRRLRNYILTLAFLGVFGFVGGVYYSRINDNFHDFFTEYVPYGEQAVLYLEELEFRKRFPNVSDRVTGTSASRPRGTGAVDQVTIPAQSGASWRVADSGEPAGRHASSVKKTGSAADETIKPKSQPEQVIQAKKQVAELPTTDATAANSNKTEPKPVTSVKETPKPSESEIEPAQVKKSTWKAPEVNEPSRWPPASPISPLDVKDADEPVVQDLVKMLNDIITVINADGAEEKYGRTIGKAKEELNKVGQKVRDIKEFAEQVAAKQLRERVDTFDKAGNELIERINMALEMQERQFRQEFEQEMAALQEAYNKKIDLVVERERQLNEQRLNNRLLEQALELQRQFANDVKQQVEHEREGRLGKLKELSSAVAGLEKLTTGWNDVIDTTARTQQLHVALDAVKAALESSNNPRPFVKELVALKETAADDPVVNAAIASINPSAYQRGLPTSAELIERFRRVAGEVRKASLLPDDAGVASHASSWVLSKVMFKKQGMAQGSDVESILTRAQTYLEEGDLDNAAREVNGLTGWAKVLSRDWLGEVRKVLEVRQALEVIQAEARLQSLRVD